MTADAINKIAFTLSELKYSFVIIINNQKEVTFHDNPSSLTVTLVLS